MKALLTACCVSLAAAGVCGQASTDQPSQGQAVFEFDDPVEITAGGEAISHLLYPTPVLHDVDSDGQRELIVGDLRGFFYQAEMIEGEDDLAFAALENMQASGKPLELNNW